MLFSAVGVLKIKQQHNAKQQLVLPSYRSLRLSGRNKVQLILVLFLYRFSLQNGHRRLAVTDVCQYELGEK